jgi:hypothetical protein
LVAEATRVSAGTSRRTDASDLSLGIARRQDDFVEEVSADKPTFVQHEAVTEF